MYFLIIFKSEVIATLLIVINSPLLSNQIKSTEISNFTLFRSLLILEIWAVAFAIILLALINFIGIMIYFLKGPLVVILSLVSEL